MGRGDVWAFLYLIASAVCTLLGGLHPVMVVAWVQPVMLLQFLHHIRLFDLKALSMALVLLITLLVQTFALAVSYAGVLTTFTFWGALYLVAASAFVTVVLLLPFLADLRYRKRYPEAIMSQPFAFTCLWTMLWHIEAAFSPLGSAGNPAYSQHSVKPIVSTVSIWGLDGVVFMMAWTAALVHQRLVLRQTGGGRLWLVLPSPGISALNARKTFSRRYESFNESMRNYPGHRPEAHGDGRGLPVRASGIQSAKGSSYICNSFAAEVAAHERALRILYAIALLTLLYAGIREPIRTGTIFHKGIAQTAKPTVGVSCILRQPEEGDAQTELLWAATSDRARAGDDFILWSEKAATVKGERGEQALLARAGEIVAAERDRRQRERGEAQGPYLGVAYEVELSTNPRRGYNVLTLLLPNGSVAFRYLKTHPAVLNEPEVIRGPGKIMAVDTPFGRVGGAIDFQFPRLLQQAPALGVDIMLQPSWTWGTTGWARFHADSYRAVENGFTLLRCASMGQSAVITPFYQVVDIRESAKKAVNVLTMQMPISPRVWTSYPNVGFLFGILVATVAAKYLFMVVFPIPWVLTISSYIFPERVNRWFVGDSYEQLEIDNKRNLALDEELRMSLLPGQ